MQTAGLTQYVQSRPEIEVIGIAQNNLRAYILLQIAMIHSFHRTHCAYGHKYGGLYSAMVSHQLACTRRAALVFGYEIELHMVVSS